MTEYPEHDDALDYSAAHHSGPAAGTGVFNRSFVAMGANNLGQIEVGCCRRHRRRVDHGNRRGAFRGVCVDSLAVCARYQKIPLQQSQVILPAETYKYLIPFSFYVHGKTD